MSSRAEQGSFPVDIRACIDRIASRFASPSWGTEIERARQEFDGLRGRVYDDEQLFASHVSAFLEWYALERPLSGGEPPVVHLLREGAEDTGGDQLLRALAVSHRSLFEVIDSQPESLRLLDLIGGGLWRVEQVAPIEGLGAGDIFEARLIPWRGRVHFGPVFLFHPRAARRQIHALIRQAVKDGSLGPDLVFILARMCLKHSRFRNISMDRIYSASLGRRGRDP